LGAEADLTVTRAHWGTSPGGIFALWAGVLTGPMVWAADLVIAYAMVPWTCGHHRAAPLHLLSLAALLAIGAAAWTSLRALTLTGEGEVVAGGRGHVAREARVVERAQFMARLGLASSGFFAIVVVATEIPRWVFDACR
jgi:hypothetical protein